MIEDIAAGMLDILVTSSINSFGTQRRFPVNIQIAELKQKLELLTGASSTSMELQLLDDKNELICKLMDDSATLNSYALDNAKVLHVVDSFHQAGEFEDLSKVKKFELSEEEYSKRGETFRAFKEKLKLQSGDEKESTEKEKKRQEEEELIKNIKVGSRCEVRVSGKPNRRGTVMYAGTTDFKPGFWVGVKYDEPLGKNDGSVGGKRYFECQQNYGSFVKPYDVILGDFPEENYDLDEL
ncbi:tubulin-folding cofactor B-like [Stegodyphus dumicola]|uniref:tubulin-folding cofactor B-like n=1 Tax=Stegodyphus dumicola TaxID=202533 RepID=UPI0015A765FC|nr:tubulin-folding cofactor B-like [Stegodyphus dumicola]XP_035217935.1 tubulin-folding cofactor B-like [Stegodyphus dumicola]